MSRFMRTPEESPEQETVPMPALGREGEPCASCRAPLAADQRYCLECGTRRGGPRVAYGDLLTKRATPPPALAGATVPPGPPPLSRTTGFNVALGLGVLLLALGVGVLIGNGGDEPQNVAASPQVVTVGGAGAGAAVAATEFASDWPSGRDGWTVELQELPVDGTDPAAVAAAKTAAQGKGAADVGALRSDDFGSLDPGSYVVYSGVFSSKKQAAAALKGLKSKFPDARVVEVSGGDGSSKSSSAGDGAKEAPKDQQVSKKQLEDLNNLSPEEYQKKSQKLPKTIGTPGKPPPKDNKPAGGGSDSIEIG
jgi:hypothetical protein